LLRLLEPFELKPFAEDDSGAGLSEKQRKTALRVANVPKEEFEAAVETDEPATVTQLAERGRRRRAPTVDHLGGRDPNDYYHATRLIGAVDALNRETKEIDLDAAKRGLWPAEAVDLTHNVLSAQKRLSEICNLLSAEKNGL